MCIWVPYRGSMLRRYPYTHYSQNIVKSVLFKNKFKPETRLISLLVNFLLNSSKNLRLSELSCLFFQFRARTNNSRTPAGGPCKILTEFL